MRRTRCAVIGSAAFAVAAAAPTRSDAQSVEVRDRRTPSVTPQVRDHRGLPTVPSQRPRPSQDVPVTRSGSRPEGAYVTRRPAGDSARQQSRLEDSAKKQSSLTDKAFWSTLPGVLTGTAAVIAAIG